MRIVLSANFGDLFVTWVAIGSPNISLGLLTDRQVLEHKNELLIIYVSSLYKALSLWYCVAITIFMEVLSMPTITIHDLQEMVKLRQAVIELEQVRILFNALAETTFTKTTDNEAASAFYALEDLFNAKLQYIAQLLPVTT